MAKTKAASRVSQDLEYCDFTQGMFFERRFINGFRGGLTVFQMGIIISVMILSVAGSSFMTFAVIRPSLGTSVLFVVFFLLLGGYLGISITKFIDIKNREMRKTQGQFFMDGLRSRFRRGHWVNGRRRPSQPTTERIVLAVGSRHLRKGGKR